MRTSSIKVRTCRQTCFTHVFSYWSFGTVLQCTFKVPLCDLGGVNRRLAWQLYDRYVLSCPERGHQCVICELLAVKHGDLELDSFSNSVLDAFIAFFCVLIFVYSCTIFTIK